MKYYISIQIYKKRALKKTASTFKTKKKRHYLLVILLKTKQYSQVGLLL